MLSWYLSHINFQIEACIESLLNKLSVILSFFKQLRILKDINLILDVNEAFRRQSFLALAIKRIRS